VFRQRFLAAAFLLTACGEAHPPEAIAPAVIEPPPPPVASIAPLPPLPVDRVVRRSITVRSRRSGTEVTVIHGDRTRDSTVESVGGGGGPRVTVHFKIAPDHTLLSFDADGHGAGETAQLIDEHFFLEAGRATWKSTVEQGTREVAGAAFFVPLAPGAESIGLLAQAAIAAGGTLPLLPDGVAHAEQVGEASVQGPNGATQPLVAWSIAGLGFAPRIVWMDAAGELWGEVGEQGATVPEGWEAAIEPLLSQVKAIERRRTEALARKLGDTPPAAGLAITHARVLDVIAKKWLEDQTVVVRGSKIVSVDPSGGGAAPVGAETIDAGGKALLPGLWDLHAHIDETSGAIDLAAGVTTVRTVGGDADPIDDLAKAFDEGRALGPHLLKGRGGHVAGDEITELSALLLNLVADHDTDAPRALRFARFAEKATAVDLGAKPVRDALRLLKEKKTIVDSTLEVFEALFDDRAGDVGAEWQSVAFRVPPQARRRFLVGGLRAPTGEEQVYAAAFSVCAKMVKALYDQKTPIVAGTESISGLTLPHELELYVKAGIPAADALAFATIGAARAVKVDKTTGSITVGKDADMVLVDGDPLKDVGDVRYSVKVVRSGIVYDSGPVFEASGIQAANRPTP
jgi:hypothetical protein